MNNNKARNGLWLVVGAYLAYTGFTLAKNVLNDRPDNYMLLAAAGILFIGVGIAVVVRSVKELRKPEEPADDEETLDEEADDEETEDDE